MISIELWRAKIGLFNCSRRSRPSSISNLQQQTTHGWFSFLSGGGGLFSSLCRSLLIRRALALLIVAVITHLLLSAGDVERNPGPITGKRHAWQCDHDDRPFWVVNVQTRAPWPLGTISKMKVCYTVGPRVHSTPRTKDLHPKDTVGSQMFVLYSPSPLFAGSTKTWHRAIAMTSHYITCVTVPCLNENVQ